MRGRYQVGDSGLRASELVHHSTAELAAARSEASRAKQEEEAEGARDELAVGDHAVGSTVFAKGSAGAGEAWYEAKVIAHRERFPPLQVKYKRTLTGDKSVLMLPAPVVAFLPLTHVTAEKPAAPSVSHRSRR